jgi:hypothetical protein
MDTPTTTATRVRAHPCIDCQALPERPADPFDVVLGAEYRPRSPRTAPFGGPRSKRCATHNRAHVKAQKSQRRETRVERVYGLPPAEQRDLWAFQGERCACGKVPGARGAQNDHAHECCPGPTSCGRCVRGLLCWSCNREIIGRLEQLFGSAGAVAALRRLADHIEDPPLARMRRGEATPYASDPDYAAGEVAA